MNRRSYITSILACSAAALALAGCGGESGSGTPTGTISGLVVNGDPATVTTRRTDATVRAYRVPVGATNVIQGALIAQTRSRPDGTFSLTVPRGNYLLEAELPERLSTAQFRPSQFTTTVAARQSVTGAVLGHVAVAP